MKFVDVLFLLSGLLASAGASAAMSKCAELERQAEQSQILIPGAQSGAVVIGKDRVAVFSAPDESCREPSVALLEGDNLDSYDEYQGYTSVLFIDLRTGNEITGWVKSDRVKKNGFGVSPN